MPTISYRVCPECSERLDDNARRCACGWKPDSGPSRDPFHGKCGWVDGGDRCRFPGTNSHAMKGDGKWLCAFHFFNGDPAHASRIVANSFDWDGKPESYLRMRKEAASRPRVVSNTGGEGVQCIQEQIRKLVQSLRPSGHKTKAWGSTVMDQDEEAA